MRRAAVLLLVLVRQVVSVHATMDGWANQTPGGSQMQENMLNLSPGYFVKPLERWYFYKRHVLGEFHFGASIGRWDARMDTSIHWFIVNESNGAVLTFSDREQWEQARSEMELVPFIWERWYRNDWRLLTNGFALYLYLYGTLLGPPLIIFAVIGILVVGVKNIHWRSLGRASAVVIGLLLIGVFLESFPQSF